MLDFLQNVDIEMYHADSLCMPESLSNSIANVLINKSPHHAWAQHPRFGGKPRKRTLKMEFGSVIDEIMTNQGRRVVEAPFPKFTTKEAKAFKADAIARGLFPVKTHDLANMHDMVERANKTLQFHNIDLEPALKQVCILWEETASNGNKVQCRALLDYFYTGGLIRDLKVTQDAKPGKKLDKKCISFGYPIQAAAYTRAVEAIYPDLAGRVRFENVWIEDSWPYEPLLSEMTGPALHYGMVMWQRAVDIWESCLRLNKWPGYMERGAAPYRIELPEYISAEMFAGDAVADEDEDEPLASDTDEGDEDEEHEDDDA